MAHQPLGGKPIAAVNPNSGHPGPLVDPVVSRIPRNSFLGSMLPTLHGWGKLTHLIDHRHRFFL